MADAGPSTEDVQRAFEEARSHQTPPMTEGGPSTENVQLASEEARSHQTPPMTEGGPSTENVQLASEEATISHQTSPEGGPSTGCVQRASEEATSLQTQPMAEAGHSTEYVQPTSEEGPQLDGRPQVGQRLTRQSMTEDKNMKKRRFNIAICTTAISAASLTSFVAASLESKITIPHHKHVLLALLGLSLTSMSVSFASGMLMLSLWAASCDNSPNMTALSKILTSGSIVSTAVGVLFGVAFGIGKMF